MKKFCFVCMLFLSALCVSAQLRVSLATNVSLVHNFSPSQQFWALGQTVEGDLHFTGREAVYAAITYHRAGRFTNELTAKERGGPSSVRYQMKSTWKLRQVSIGWKHYLKGRYDSEYEWNLYGIAGFGLVFMKVSNSYTRVFDTAAYVLPMPVEGTATVYRLSFDLGGGFEVPVGGNFFVYTELKTWIPASDDPSKYLYSNKKVPMPLLINGGLRILFGY